jgi:very-short-patch-repair endonuclease
MKVSSAWTSCSDIVLLDTSGCECKPDRAQRSRKRRVAAPKAQTGWWFNVREKIHNLPNKKTLRQKLRHIATPAEKLLWKSLKNSGAGAKFRRQHSVGSYVLDFYCPEHKLAIEVEGRIHDDVLVGDYDAERQSYLESKGIRILYFKNRELLELTDFVVGAIRTAVLEPPPRLRR